MTFEQVWREVRTEFPLVPPLMMRSWAQEGLNKACDQWAYAFQRSENALITTAARNSIPVSVTLGSNVVTSAGQFLPADAGRQFRVGTIGTNAAAGLPIYTITAYVDPNTITLDLPYSRDTNPNGNAQIIDIYTTMPADFKRFLVIIDTYYLRTLPFWLNEDQIAIADPGRVFTDTGPRYVIARKYSSYPPTRGQVQYEFWPAPTAARSYPYLYISNAPQLADTDTLPGVFLQRADALKSYIRYRATLWPGGSDQKNPGYSPGAAPLWMKEWAEAKNSLELADDNEYPQQLMTIHWMRRFGAIAPTATLLRQTDATINDYF